MLLPGLVTRSKWRSVSFVHGLVAGLYIGYGWIHNIEGCAFKGSGVANLYLDRDVNSVNVLNNNFAASDGIGIIANSGEVAPPSPPPDLLYFMSPPPPHHHHHHCCHHCHHDSHHWHHQQSGKFRAVTLPRAPTKLHVGASDRRKLLPVPWRPVDLRQPDRCPPPKAPHSLFYFLCPLSSVLSSPLSSRLSLLPPFSSLLSSPALLPKSTYDTSVGVLVC